MRLQQKSSLQKCNIKMDKSEGRIIVLKEPIRELKGEILKDPPHLTV